MKFQISSKKKKGAIALKISTILSPELGWLLRSGEDNFTNDPRASFFLSVQLSRSRPAPSFVKFPTTREYYLHLARGKKEERERASFYSIAVTCLLNYKRPRTFLAFAPKNLGRPQ